jgi:hypothetical protein
MLIFEVMGEKGDHRISEQVHSHTKADWIAAHYVAHGYKVEVKEITPVRSGSVGD